MALLELHVIPIGTSTPSMGDYIAEVIRVCREEGLKHRLTDMGTILEGEVDQLFQVARKLHEIPFRRGIQRVVTSLTVDDRRDKAVHLDDKVHAVMARLG